MCVDQPHLGHSEHRDCSSAHCLRRRRANSHGHAVHLRGAGSVPVKRVWETSSQDSLLRLSIFEHLIGALIILKTHKGPPQTA